jgi:hypothetical protein
MRELRLEKAPLIFCLLCVALLVTFPLYSLDLFWHLANGRAMVGEGRIVNEELFSYTAQGRITPNHEWLTQIVFYLVFDSLGAGGLIALKVLISLLAAFLIYRTSRLMGADSLGASVLAVFAVYAGLARFTMRPQLISFLFIGLLMCLLYGHRDGRVRGRWLLVIPPLMALWDIMHGAVYGLVFLTAFVLGESLKAVAGRKQGGIKALWGAYLLALAFMALNPYGLRTYDTFLRIMTDRSIFITYNFEYLAATPQNQPVFWAVLVLLGVLALAFIRRTDPTHVLTVLPFALMALQRSRAIGVFFLVSAPVLAYYYALITRESGYPQRNAWWRWLRYALAALLVLFIVKLKFLAPYSVQTFGSGINENLYPVGAARFVREADLKGNMYNPGFMGGYLSYTLYPGRRIYAYNHHILFGDIIEKSQGRGIIEEYDINYAFIENIFDVWSQLIFSGDQWVPVYRDRTVTVVLKNTPENAALIDKYGLE